MLTINEFYLISASAMYPAATAMPGYAFSLSQTAASAGAPSAAAAAAAAAAAPTATIPIATTYQAAAAGQHQLQEARMQ